MVIALIGATGMVGQVMMKVMEERGLPVREFIPCASSRSQGKKVVFQGREYRLGLVGDAIDAKPDIAIFSAGAAASRQYAEAFASKGTFVIDNSSAWRGHENVPLVVPEINAGTINEKTRIIANPNCSTIQMVLPLAPVHREYGLKRLVISTYQSVTGTGVKAVQQLNDERAGIEGEKAYPHQIDLNCLPHGGDFDESGYTSEELKLVNETRKILNDPGIKITATVVRVPVTGGHSEAVNAELGRDFSITDIKRLLGETAGVEVMDDPQANFYPMPVNAAGRDEVFVGRIRRDTSVPYGLNMWIVADNLRKGAATNAIQIAQYLIEKKLVK